ncbi:hypothetical protein UXN85_20730 [Enterobacter hormaechei]
MKKHVLAVLVVAASVATSACAVNHKTQEKFDRSGCTMTSQFNGCDINKSYEWNRKHGFIEDDNDGQRHHGKHHAKRSQERYDDGHASSGIQGGFAGNYVAKFRNGQHVADIHVEDSGVYINGRELRDTNQVGDVLTFRDSSVTYTLRKHGRSSWEDLDAGNTGVIVRE